MTEARARSLAPGAAAVLLAVIVLFLPWYALGNYVPNGWDATWFARLALAAGVAAALVARLGGPSRLVLALWVVAVALIAVRVVRPPDFGFSFSGLEVPVERRVGCWAGLAAAALGALTALSAARPRRESPAAAP